MKRLKGKVLVIVGGTSGLGISAARACVREGARVVLVGRSATRLKAALASLGPAASGITGDARKAATASRAIRLALTRFRAFHGLYHVAGGSGRNHGDGPLHEITEGGWRYTLEENLTSLFLSNRAAVRQFLKQGNGGAVLNMTSVLGWSPSPAHFGTHAYAAAKAAVLGFTKSCAAYYAHNAIRFNAIAPALVATPMSERAQTKPDIMAYVRTKQPLDGGRIGQPEDLDEAVVWLMSDAARFVTGQVITVDGGWSVCEGQRRSPTG